MLLVQFMPFHFKKPKWKAEVSRSKWTGITLHTEEKRNPAKLKDYYSSLEKDSLSESETCDQEDSVNDGNEVDINPVMKFKVA